jgi:uncharacterized protein (TIGR03437 family)
MRQSGPSFRRRLFVPLFLMIVAVLPASRSAAQAVITTVAGTTWTFRGDGGPATQAPLGELYGIAVDSAGNVFALDRSNQLVVRVAPSGILKVVAGRGVSGFSGDGGAATNAALSFGTAATVAVDMAGNVYIADRSNQRIRKVTVDGTITTVAGNGAVGFSGDGGPATRASLNNPIGLAVDASGNLYIADTYNHRIRKISPDGAITTVAGSGVASYSGDGGAATAAGLNKPIGVAVDAAGSLYIVDADNARIRKVPRGGIITTVAGNGIAGYSGDGGPAVSASLYYPPAVAADPSGSLYIADEYNHRIRRVSPIGIITTVAGNGTAAFSGDGGPAADASFNSPHGVALDAAGDVYVTDSASRRIRRFIEGGTISSIAGNGLFKTPTDGVPGTASFLSTPAGIGLDRAGNLYIADLRNQRIRKLTPTGIITTVAGNGIAGFSGDGGPATAASLRLDVTSGVAVDEGGNLCIADTGNSRIRKVDPAGIITTFAGGGGSLGDGGPATRAAFNGPFGVAVDATGNLYITDWGNNRIRKVSPGGIISTVVGNGIPGFSGDGGSATTASLNYPRGVAVDSAGNIYIADTSNNRIRKVDPSGIITTVAGNGVGGFSGDGGPATEASLYALAVALDKAGALYVATEWAHRIRRLTPDGRITTVAGNGSGTYSGDGGTSTGASLCGPRGVAVDAAGNVYISDSENDRIRKVLATPPGFSVTPAKLSFSAPAGTPDLASQQIATSSPITGLVWRVEASTEDGAPWLGFSPPVGFTPGSVAVSASVLDMKPGSYRGTVTIQAPLGATPTLAVAVDLTVTVPIPPQLVVEPSSLEFEILVGTGNPTPRSLRITNGGDGVLKWTAQANAAPGATWLSISQASGTASGSSPATVQVSVNAAGLSPGVYSGSIQVQSATTNQTRTIPVTFLLTRPVPTILVSQTGLLFTGVEGGSVVPPQSIGILNIGQSVMSWRVEASTLAGGDWLSVSPTTGSSTANSLDIPLVDVAVNVKGLRSGTYNGLLRVSAPDANNTPQVVTVVLSVLPPGSNPGVLVRPTGLIFAAQTGTASPSAQEVKLATAAPGTLGFVHGLLTYDGGTWLEAGTRNSLVSPESPTTISVEPVLGKLAAGVYRGTLALLFGDGSSQTVNILFLAVAGSMRTAAAGGAAAACVSQQLFGAHRTLGSASSAAVGWPTLIEVRVVDNCGTPASDATVVASFSSGDPPLPLTSLRNGTYVGTWRPSKAGAQVVIRVRGALPPLTPVDLPSVQLNVASNASAPAVNAGGIVNAASFAGGGVLAPGSIISVFGRQLAASTGGASAVPLPTTLGGATLSVGGRDVPLFFSSEGQINAQLPFELASGTRPQAMVKLATGFTVPETIIVGASQPGIFTVNQQGTGQGAILDKNGKLVDASAAAKAGDIVQVFCTGLGPTNPAVASGQAGPKSEPLARVVAAVEARIGDKPAVVHFAGLAPGFVGLYQVNVQVPDGLAPGPAVSLVLTQNGVASNTVTLALQ